MFISLPKVTVTKVCTDLIWICRFLCRIVSYCAVVKLIPMLFNLDEQFETFLRKFVDFLLYAHCSVHMFFVRVPWSLPMVDPRPNLPKIVIQHLILILRLSKCYVGIVAAIPKFCLDHLICRKIVELFVIFKLLIMLRRLSLEGGDVA